MATIGLCVRAGKANKTGLVKVEVAVRHGAGKTAYIATDVVCVPEHFVNGMLTRKHVNYIKDNNRLSELLDMYQDRLDGIKAQNVYTVQQIKALLVGVEREDRELTYAVWSLRTENELKAEGKGGTAEIRRSTRLRFVEFAKGDVCLCDITQEMVRGFALWLKTHEKTKITRAKRVVPKADGHGALLQWYDVPVKVRAFADGTVSQTLCTFRAVVNAAIRRHVVKYEYSPVDDMNIKAAPVNHAEVSAEAMNKLIGYVPGEGMGQGRRVAVDALLLSFYLGGVNMKDLMKIEFDLDKYRFTYQREKAKDRTAKPQVVELPLFPRAKVLLRKYLKNGRVVWPMLPNSMNHLLKKVAKECGIDERLCHNSARKSFAKYATHLGCDQMTLNYVIGHADNRGKGMEVMKYYTEAEFEGAFRLMKRVFDYVDDPAAFDSESRKEMMRVLMG